jgi:hypothetical protein
MADTKLPLLKKPPAPLTEAEYLALVAKQIERAIVQPRPKLSESELAQNPYYQCHAQAEETLRAKRQALNERDAWWTNPENYLEDYDITDASPREMMRAGAYIYSSLPTNPNYKEGARLTAADNFGSDVPRDALLGMLQTALKIRGIRHITRKQDRALQLARQAKAQGLNPALYVSEQMGISLSAAYKILQRVDAIEFAEEMSKNITVSALDGRRVQMRVLPSDTDVQKKRKTMKRCCIVCQADTGDGRMPLCRDCHRKYRVEGDFSDLDVSPESLERMIRFSNAQHRHDARYEVAVERFALVDEA